MCRGVVKNGVVKGQEMVAVIIGGCVVNFMRRLW